LKIKENLKLKENFPNLSAKKIKNIHNTINNTGKPKPHINMATKGPSHKQIIVFISNENITKFMTSSGEHIAYINHTLKGIKSDVSIDFICFDHCGLIITSNKVIFPSNLSVVKNYIKNINSID